MNQFQSSYLVINLNESKTKELYLHRDGLQSAFFCLKLAVFCFEECRIDYLLAIQLILRMIKTANKECITFNEPRNYFYLIDALFCLYFFPRQSADQK